MRILLCPDEICLSLFNLTTHTVFLEISLLLRDARCVHFSLPHTIFEVFGRNDELLTLMPCVKSFFRLSSQRTKFLLFVNYFIFLATSLQAGLIRLMMRLNIISTGRQDRLGHMVLSMADSAILSFSLRSSVQMLPLVA